MKTSLLASLLVALAATLFATLSTASAATTLYSTQVAFTAAAPAGLATIDFEGIAAAGGTVDYSTAAGFSSGGVNIVGEFRSQTVPNPPTYGYFLHITDAAAPGPGAGYYDWGTGASIGGHGAFQTGTFGGTSGDLLLTLPAGIKVVSFNVLLNFFFLGSLGPPHAVTLEINGGSEILTATPPAGGPPATSFVGLISPNPISTLKISVDSARELHIDNLSFGAPPVARPRLDIAMLPASRVLLAWPTNSTGYALEHSSSLTVNGWAAVTNSIATAGEFFSVTVDIEGAKRLFRLRKP